MPLEVETWWLGDVVLVTPPPTTKQGGLVMSSTCWGVPLWKFRAKRTPDDTAVLSVVRNPASNEKPWVFLPVTDFAQVKAAESQAVSPIEVAKVMQGPTVGKAILLRNKEANCPLLKFEAKQGFKMMTCHLIGKLYDILKVREHTQQRKTPTREADLLKALIMFVIPDASDQEVQEAIAARGATLPEQNALSGLEHNFDCIEHSVDDDDREVLKKITQVVLKRAEQKGIAATLNGKAMAGPPVALAPPRPGQTWKLRPFPRKDDWNSSDAKAFIPKAKGCVLPWCTKRFSRCAGHYTGKSDPPYSVSKSWGPHTGHSVHSALVFVLKQLWCWHEEMTKERCDVDIDELAPKLPNP